MVCKGCGSNSVAIDESAGNTVCTNCGVVCEENNIVSEITFGENAAGGAAVHAGVGFGTVHGNKFNSDSRVSTIENAQKIAQALANQLNLGAFVERAMRFFKLALQDSFTRGRRLDVTIATCLYIATRYDKVGLMLINFSEAIGVNVFQLGSAYLAICKRLLLNDLPPIDASLYVSRFCSILKFGEKTQDVIHTACTYLKRMEKDWILDGRRPAGVCGVLLAARTLGFKCTTKDFIGVVKMTEDTILKRLLEFSETPSGNLTVNQFSNIFLEEAQFPPSFKKSKANEAEAKRKADDAQFNDRGDGEEGDEVDETESEVFSAVIKDSNKNDKDREADEFERVRNFENDMLKYLSESKDEAAKEVIQLSDENEKAELDKLDEDPEIQNCILSNKEFLKREARWVKENEDWLEKEKAKEERIKAGISKNPPKRRAKRAKAHREFAAGSVIEAFNNMVNSEKMPHLKRLSKKINYDMLKEACKEDNPDGMGLDHAADQLGFMEI